MATDNNRQSRIPNARESLTLPNDVMTVPTLNDFITGFCQQTGLDERLTKKMRLAVEEAVVNVMSYAYPTGVSGDVLIEADADDDRLQFVITDSGIPFDPTRHAEVDTSLGVDQRRVGGLGIYLVRQIMDSISYERIEGKNILTLRYLINNKV